MGCKDKLRLSKHTGGLCVHSFYSFSLVDFMYAHTSFIIYGLILYKRFFQTMSSLEVWTMQLVVQ